ncbi:MAG: hypothetical protein AMXMBFR25_26060 [Lysobacterales bacterium]
MDHALAVRREQEPSEQSRMLLQGIAWPLLAAFHVGLHGVPRLARDDGLMLAGIGAAAVGQFAQVDPIAQHLEQEFLVDGAA